MATQNPIESEGTYPLPEAQVDRFMFKLLVDYPAARDEVAVVERSLAGGGEAREVLSPAALARHQRAAQAVYVDRRVMEYAVALTTATRERGEHGWVEFGASPRGSINLVHAGRALALLRGRDYVLPSDVRDLARDVLRHRIVLTYEALAAGRRRRPRARRRARAGARPADRAGRRGHADRDELPRAAAARRARPRPARAAGLLGRAAAAPPLRDPLPGGRRAGGRRGPRARPAPARAAGAAVAGRARHRARRGPSARSRSSSGRAP